MDRDDIDTSKYPEIFRNFLEKEKQIVINFVKGSNSVLDIACGNGRIISEIAPLVKSYIGIDIDDEYIKIAKKITRKYKNVEILKVNAEELSSKFKNNQFEKSICLFNSLCSFKDDKLAMKEIFKVTKDSCFLTVCAKGTLDKRKLYYDAMNIPFKFDKDETTYSNAWGFVRAYSRDEIENLCKSAGFKVKDIFLIEELCYGVMLEK